MKLVLCHFWNHFDTEGMPQTNNNIEAYNLKLKKYLGNAHPNLYKSVGFFRELELESLISAEAGSFRYNSNSNSKL